MLWLYEFRLGEPSHFKGKVTTQDEYNFLPSQYISTKAYIKIHIAFKLGVHALHLKFTVLFKATHTPKFLPYISMAVHFVCISTL